MGSYSGFRFVISVLKGKISSSLFNTPGTKFQILGPKFDKFSKPNHDRQN